MALEKFEDDEYPLTEQGSFRKGSYRGHAYCFRFRKFKGVTVYVKRTDRDVQQVYTSGYADIATLERVARSRIDLYLKSEEQQRLRSEALKGFVSRCRDNRNGFCHRCPPYKCSSCSCKGKHDFLWDYDERHGLIHTFG